MSVCPQAHAPSLTEINQQSSLPREARAAKGLAAPLATLSPSWSLQDQEPAGDSKWYSKGK